VGNRALGERIAVLAAPQTLTAALAVVLLAPSPPLIFMGEEYGATTPFLYFCDYAGELARAVRDGRGSEFSRFESFRTVESREQIPDPNAIETFEKSRLDWSCLSNASHATRLACYRELLALRRREIVPLLRGIQRGAAEYRLVGASGLDAWWRIDDGSRLRLLANLGVLPLAWTERPSGRLLYATDGQLPKEVERGTLPPWSAGWYLE
jgi:1,4-alpha-glucan branching enzyme